MRFCFLGGGGLEIGLQMIKNPAEVHGTRVAVGASFRPRGRAGSGGAKCGLEAKFAPLQLLLLT